MFYLYWDTILALKTINHIDGYLSNEKIKKDIGF
jgi:hypothetical protein